MKERLQELAAAVAAVHGQEIAWTTADTYEQHCRRRLLSDTSGPILVHRAGFDVPEEWRNFLAACQPEVIEALLEGFKEDLDPEPYLAKGDVVRGSKGDGVILSIDEDAGECLVALDNSLVGEEAWDLLEDVVLIRKADEPLGTSSSTTRGRR